MVRDFLMRWIFFNPVASWLTRLGHWVFKKQGEALYGDRGWDELFDPASVSEAKVRHGRNADRQVRRHRNGV